MANPTLAITIQALVQGLSQLDDLVRRLTQLGVLAAQPIQVNTSVTQSNFERLSSTTQGVDDQIGQLKNQLIALAGTVFTFDFFKDAIKSGIEFNAETETAKLGIASLIAAQAGLTDAAGNQLNAVDSLNVAQGLATDQLGKLRLAGLQTSATFGELSQAYQGAVGAGLAVGLNLDQIRTTTVQITQAAGALGVPMNQLNQEVKAILSGNIDNNAVVASSLGISNAMVQSWKEQGIFAEELNKKLEVFSASGDLIAQTYEASFSNVKEALDTVLGTATQGIFSKLKDQFNNFFNTIIDSTSGTIKAQAEGAIAGLRSIFDGVGTIVGGTIGLLLDIFKRVSAYLTENADKVESFKAALSSLGDSIGNVITQMVGVAGAIATDSSTLIALKIILTTTQQLINVVAFLLDGFNHLPAPIQTLVIGFGLLSTVVLPFIRTVITGLGAMGAGLAENALGVARVGASWVGAGVAVNQFIVAELRAASVAAATELQAANAAVVSARAIQVAAEASLATAATAQNLANAALATAKVNQALAVQQAAAARTAAAANAVLIAQQDLLAARTAANTGLLARAFAVLGKPVTITLILAGAWLTATAVVDSITKSLERNSAAQKALEASYAATAGQFATLSNKYRDEALSLKAYATTKIKTAEELGRLDASEIASYAERIKGRRDYDKAVLLSLQRESQSLQSRIELTSQDEKGAAATAFLKQQLAALTPKLDEASAKYKESADSLVLVTAKSEDFANQIETGSKKAIETLIGKFDEAKQKSGLVAKGLEEVVSGLGGGKVDVGSVAVILNSLQELQDKGKITADQLKKALSGALSKLSTEDLTQFMFSATLAFDTTKEKAASTSVAIDHIRVAIEAARDASIGKLGINFEELSTKVTTSTRATVTEIVKINDAFTQNQELFRKQLALTSADVQKQRVALQDEFNKTAKALDALSKSDSGRLKIAEHLEDVRAQLQKISEQGQMTAEEFAASQLAMQQDAQNTSLVLRASFDKALKGASTIQDLELIKEKIDQASDSGALFGDDLKNTMDELHDRTLQLAGAIEGALGDSFKRLGIVGGEAIKNVAELALSDLKRIVDSGKATNGELIDAYKKATDTAVSSANTQARSIGEVANAAELSRVRITNATLGIGNAFTELGITPINETKVQVRELAVAFDKVEASGLLSAAGLTKAWGDFANKVVEAQGDVVGTALRVQAAASGVLLNITDAWSRMGVRTRAEMQAIADQSLRDFTTISNSGQATTATLATAFEKYAKAAIEAAGGLDANTEAMLRSQASAYGLIDVFDKLIAKQKESVRTLGDVFTEYTQKLASGIGGILDSLGAGIGRVSQKAQAMFTAFITGNQQAASSLSPLELRLQSLDALLSTPRDALKSAGAIGAFLDGINRKAAELEAMAIREQLAVQKIDNNIKSGTKSLSQMAASIAGVIRNSQTLDDQSLSNLKGQLQETRNAIIEVQNAARGVISSLSDMGDSFKEQLLRAKGDLKTLEDLDYQRKLRELADKRDEVTKNPETAIALKNEAIAAFERAKSNLDALHAFNVAELDAKIAEDQAKREADAKAKQDEIAQKALDDAAQKQAELDARNKVDPIIPQPTDVTNTTADALASTLSDTAQAQIDALEAKLALLTTQGSATSSGTTDTGTKDGGTLNFYLDATNLLSEENIRRNIAPVIQKYLNLSR